MGISLNRIQPMLDVRQMRTFQVDAPLATHWRRASCAEVDCPDYLNGFVTTVLAGSDDEDALKASGRKWSSTTANPDGTISYTFEAGTECWSSFRHRVRVREDSLWIVRDGDWRGNPTGRARRHTRPADWVDEFADHQDKLAEAQRRG
jgi:hypothetical protein